MPINEIHAPVYIKGKYSTPDFADGHAFRLYFASGSAWLPGVSGDEENWRLANGSTPIANVDTIVHEVFTRRGSLLQTGTAVLNIELWQSVPDADNLLVHLNPLPEGNSYGANIGVASSFFMTIYAGALRDQWRFTTFDGASASPQKFPPNTYPTGDNATFGWYILKSLIPFATNDGIRLTREVSSSSGYNRRLARTYGRTIAP